MLMSELPPTAAATVGRNSAIMLGASIPISVALDNVLIAMIALCWLLDRDWRTKIQSARDNPVAAAALLLFGVLCIGALYPTGNSATLLKYIDLLLIPAFMHFFRDEQTRRRALILFCCAACASVVVSYMAHWNLLANGRWLPGTLENPSGFKNSITHNLIVALASYLFALFALKEKRTSRRMLYIALSLLAAHNVIFMVYGRTGYLVVAALFTYLALAHFGRRGFVYVSLIMVATFTTAYWTSNTFHHRIDSALNETSTWSSNAAASTSVSLRLEWYAHTINVIRENPLAGTGTGSFPAAYAKEVEGRGMMATVNPHNEYLLLTVQTGAIGLACLLFLFFRQWRSAVLLATPQDRHLARGLVLTFVIGCLFNSLLIDHTEGLLFAWMSGLVFVTIATEKRSAAVTT